MKEKTIVSKNNVFSDLGLKDSEEMKARHEKELGAMRAAFEERVSRIEREMAARDGGRNIAAAFSR